jgi:hypothetical protein
MWTKWFSEGEPLGFDPETLILDGMEQSHDNIEPDQQDE